MATRVRDYNIYGRKKLPRNKYGLLENGDGTGSSLFSNSGGGSSGTNFWGDSPVGDIMATLEEFIGATATEPGFKGLVPGPEAGMNQHFLQGSGSWVDIPAFRYFVEWPESPGLEKRGLSLNGDLNVTDTITTQNLEVTGASHFWSLVIDEVKANGGQLIVSPSLFKIDYVGGSVEYSIFDADGPLYQVIAARADIYNILKANNVEKVRCRRLYQRNDDGERAIENECQIGDMMRCRSFNIKAGTYRNVSNTDYWSFVVNTGEENYTDEDGNTYSAFYIDLAYTLRKADGHNIPLGTKLFLDGREPEYPKGFTEITDALELKQTNQDVLDGTRDVENEYFENSEWTDIQEYIIKIRGLDDQMEDITGLYSKNKLYDNDLYIDKTKESLDVALYGNSSDYLNDIDNTNSTNSNRRRMLSNLDQASMILGGVPSDGFDSLDISQMDYANQFYADATLGVTEPNVTKQKLTLKSAKQSSITLAKNTVLEKDFVVAEDVYEDGFVGDDSRIIYNKGTVVGGGTTIIKDLPVIDVLPEDKYFKVDEDTPVVNPFIPAGDEVSEEEKDVIESFDPSTSQGIDVNANAQEEVNYNTLTEWEFGYCGYYPNFRIRVSDNLACLGHLFDSTRQNAIVLSSTNPIDPELLAPAMAQYSGIDRFGVNISDYRITAIAANGNEFMGSFFINYNNTFVEVNDRIQMFINDVTTGLESCGIHLDGQSSSIKMVGTIDLKQHSQTSYDTLNVYDNLNTKRVEITPFPVPKISSDESQIDTGKYSIPYVSNRVTVPKNYVTKQKYWDPFASGNTWNNIWHKQREYILKDYRLNLTVAVDLGQLYIDWELDLRDLFLYLKFDTYFGGSKLITDHGLGKQEVAGLEFTLKRNGVAIPEMTNVPINYTQPGGINTNNVNIYSSLLADNYKVKVTGAYSLEIHLIFKTYAYYRTTDDISNYYYTISSSFGGTISYDMKKMSRLDEGKIETTDGYKLTVGTDGLVAVSNNSHYVYIAKDGVDMRWDNAQLLMNDTYGLRIRKEVLDTDDTITILPKYDIVNCSNSKKKSYTVTLPDGETFGQGRTITIFGFGAGSSVTHTGKLTVQTANEQSNIMINVFGTSITGHSITFGNGDGTPNISLQLMAIGNNWYGISAM